MTVENKIYDLCKNDIILEQILIFQGMTKHAAMVAIDKIMCNFNR